MRASGASELNFLSYFHILKLLFAYFLQCFVVTSDTLSQKHIYLQVSNDVCIHNTINEVSLYYLWYGAIYKRQYINKTLILRESMYMRVSEASELRIFLHFRILKLLFLSIFCWYFRYFVGIYDMLVGSQLPTNFQMYRQNSKKTLSCPPSSGYASFHKNGRAGIRESNNWKKH